MYKPPSPADLSLLDKKQLTMCCFAEYSVYLHFGDGTIVTVESAFEHVISGKRPHKYSFPINDSKLMRLIAQRVEVLYAQSDGTLCLQFSNGDMLIIKGENGPYEAYHIQYARSQITV
ncbi:MAG TPA: hypothetical protein VGM07_09335 [Stellaceae bacterium]